MNRPELPEALMSVERQTYPNIEIILVDATGAGLDRQKNLTLSTPMTQVSGGTPWNRPAAANIALQNARGAYLMFLDEDDWIAEQHVSNLVEALDATPGVLAAYSSTQKTEADGSPCDVTFDRAFDPILLRRDNYIPIHAVLFARELIERGCRFDEELDIYEDWDFWLQCAQLSEFVHIAAVTAFYRIGGDSATAIKNNKQKYVTGSVIANARAKVLDKWLGDMDGTLLNAILGTLDASDEIEQLHSHTKSLSTHIDDLGTHIDELSEHNENLTRQIRKATENIEALTFLTNTLHNEKSELRGELADKNRQIDVLEKHQALILGSISWRLTKPLRWINRELISPIFAKARR